MKAKARYDKVATELRRLIKKCDAMRKDKPWDAVSRAVLSQTKLARGDFSGELTAARATTKSWPWRGHQTAANRLLIRTFAEKSGIIEYRLSSWHVPAC